MKRFLDLANWPRRATFDFYRGFDKPYFNICTRLDLTALVALKPRLPGGLSLACHHLVMQMANELEPFRYRLEDGRVRVLDANHASLATLRHDDSIAFTYLFWDPDYPRFAADSEPRLRAVQQGRTPFDPGLDQTAALHFTTLPWVDFSSFSHARNWGREDSVPKIAFGRAEAEGGRLWLPFSVEVHHALMDGLHVGRYVEDLEAVLAQPEALLGAAA